MLVTKQCRMNCGIPFGSNEIDVRAIIEMKTINNYLKEQFE